MEKWKANLLGIGIAILSVSFIFVLSYTLFPKTSYDYNSCQQSSLYSDTYEQTGYSLNGQCVSYDEYSRATSEAENNQNTKIFVTSLILSALTLFAALSIRKVAIVGMALTWSGAIASFISISMGYDSFSSTVRTVVLGLALVGFSVLAYYKLPDLPAHTSEPSHLG